MVDPLVWIALYAYKLTEIIWVCKLFRNPCSIQQTMASTTDQKVPSITDDVASTTVDHDTTSGKVDDKALDVAAAFLNRVDNTPYAAKEEKALRWRLDKRLIPILWFNITLGAVDKSTISTGALCVCCMQLQA